MRPLPRPRPRRRARARARAATLPFALALLALLHAAAADPAQPEAAPDSTASPSSSSSPSTSSTSPSQPPSSASASAASASTEPSSPPQPDDTHAHVAFFRHEHLGTDPAALSVLLDGRPADDVLLHNATALSFRVPSALLTDRARLQSTFVDILLNRRRLLRLPLVALESAITRVDLAVLRRDALSSRAPAAPRAAAASASASASASAPPGARALPAAAELADAEALLQRDTPGARARALPLLRAAAGAGNPRAMTTLASLHLFAPPPAARNLTLAAELLHNASSVGLPSAQALLGFLHASGIAAPTAPKDLATALLLWTVAARAGSAYAKMALAFRWYYGTDLPENCDLAAAYYRDVADDVYERVRAQDAGPHLQRRDARRRRAATSSYELDPKTGKPRARAAGAGDGADGGDDLLGENGDVLDDDDDDDDYVDVRDGDLLADEADDDDATARTARARDEVLADEVAAFISAPTPPAIHLSERKHLSDSGSSGSLGEATEIVQYSQHLAERGDATAQMMMGRLYFHGAADVPRDIQRARTLFDNAARAGKAEAHGSLGLIDLQLGKFASAVKHLTKAAKGGDRSGLTGLGYAKLFGIGVAQNADDAAKLFMAARSKEHAEAVYNLAVLYGHGLGVKQSGSEMRKHLEIAARLGNVRAMYRLGAMLLEGATGARNCQQGTVYLKEVAQRGDWSKVLGLALRAYERGRYGDALTRYLRAAHAGIEEAQYNAAYMYEHGSVANGAGVVGDGTGGLGISVGVGGGMGVSMNVNMGLGTAQGDAHVEDAMDMYQMSAAQGNSHAMVRMGDLAFGKGSDYVRAMRAYERAVKHRSAEAMFNLGWMHARGVGMTADRHMAKRYFDMAIETDDRAKIPAGIALFWLRHGDEFADAEQKLLQAWAAACELVPPAVAQWVRGRDGTGVSSDVVVVSVLLGLLVLVVNARQRRLMTRRQAVLAEEGDGGMDGAMDGGPLPGEQPPLPGEAR